MDEQGVWRGLEMRPENQGGPGSREPSMLGLDMVQTWWEVIGHFKVGLPGTESSGL